MPALLLGVRQGERFDVVGKHSPESSDLSHVGLLWMPTDLSHGALVKVAHMASEPELPGEIHVHVVGWLEGMTRAEIDDLETWTQHMVTRGLDCKYICRPAQDRRVNKTSGEVTYRYSCAGFVEAAYQHAGVRLVVDETRVPPVSLETVRRVWAHLLGDFPEDKLKLVLKVLGLPVEEEPWPVLLPGYLLRALAQKRAGLPYQPVAADLSFAG
jgi:hypothetical protein